FQAEDGIRDRNVTGVQTCALPIFTAYEEFTKGNIDEALSLYQTVDYDSEVVAQQLFNAGQYQQAIETDNSFLERVIQELYNNQEEVKIAELNSENLDEGTTSKL